MSENLEVPKKLGRPPGRRSGAKLIPLGKLSKWDNYSTPPKMDYRHEDIETLVGRQLSMVGLAQDRVRQEMLGLTADGQPGKIVNKPITLDDVERLNDLSTALVRSIDALQRATKVADELKNKLTPEQVLDAAIEKIKTQDVPTITEIIKLLTKHRARDPRHNSKAVKTIAAADGIASLEE